MAYRALGEVADWPRLYASASEVYLWRAVMSGAKLGSAADALSVLRAAAKAQDYDLDVKALVVSDPAAPEPSIDLVMTSDSSRPYVIKQKPDDLAAKVALDPELRQRFPAVAFRDSQLLILSGPPDAVDFWRQHETIWDDQVGPMQPWAEQRGAYLGVADDGPRVAPWPMATPPNLNGGKQNGKEPAKGAGSALQFVLLLAAGIGAAWVAADMLCRHKEIAT